MNILDTIDLYAGGQGSGPKSPCPQCGPHTGRAFEHGDTVKLKEGATVHNPQTGEHYKVKPGRKMTVINILPKVGTAEQMVAVNIGSRHNVGLEGTRNLAYAKMSDLVLHAPAHPDIFEKMPLWTKPWFKPTPESPKEWRKLDIQPVPRSQVVMQTTTHDGARLTYVKPQGEKEEDPKNLSAKEHNQKGEFVLTNKVAGQEDRPGYTRNTRIYDTSGMPAHFHTGPGSTVWVSSYVKEGKISDVVVREQNYTTHGQKTSAYEFAYKKGAANASGMLNNRYGIKLSMKRLRGMD